MMLGEAVDIHQNILCAVAFALLAVCLDASPKRGGYRNYVITIIAAVLAAGLSAERWLHDSGLFASGAAGFTIGILADDIIANLRATLPQAAKDIVNAVFDGIKYYIGRLFGMRRNAPPADTDGFSDDYDK